MAKARTKKIVYAIILAGILAACNELPTDNPIEEMIIGNWSNMTTNDTIQSLEKFEELPNDKYAIAFMENGKLKEIKNAGWCGTPPISYGEFEGTWHLLNDSTLLIKSGYWGGDMTMTWILRGINTKKLKYYILEYFYEDLN